MSVFFFFLKRRYEIFLRHCDSLAQDFNPKKQNIEIEKDFSTLFIEVRFEASPLFLFLSSRLFRKLLTLALNLLHAREPSSRPINIRHASLSRIITVVYYCVFEKVNVYVMLSFSTGYPDLINGIFNELRYVTAPR